MQLRADPRLIEVKNDGGATTFKSVDGAEAMSTNEVLSLIEQATEQQQQADTAAEVVAATAGSKQSSASDGQPIDLRQARSSLPSDHPMVGHTVEAEETSRVSAASAKEWTPAGSSSAEEQILSLLRSSLAHMQELFSACHFQEVVQTMRRVKSQTKEMEQLPNAAAYNQQWGELQQLMLYMIHLKARQTQVHLLIQARQILSNQAQIQNPPNLHPIRKRVIMKNNKN